jgi:hypothetical protein
MSVSNMNAAGLSWNITRNPMTMQGPNPKYKILAIARHRIYLACSTCTDMHCLKHTPPNKAAKGEKTQCQGLENAHSALPKTHEPWGGTSPQKTERVFNFSLAWRPNPPPPPPQKKGR